MGFLMIRWSVNGSKNYRGVSGLMAMRPIIKVLENRT